MIGVEMHEVNLRQFFDACLLKDSELVAGPEAWVCYEDRFTRWSIEEGEEG